MNEKEWREFKLENSNMQFDRQAANTKAQRFQLWKKTGLPWEERKNWHWGTRGECSDLISAIFEYCRKSTKPERKSDLADYIEFAVRWLTGQLEWDISKLDTSYIPQRKKDRRKRRGGKENVRQEGGERQEDGVEQEDSGEEVPEDEEREELPELEPIEPEKKDEEDAKQGELEFEDEDQDTRFKNYEVPEWYIKPKNFDQLAAMVEAGLQVCFVGPAGCGKSVTAEVIAAAIGADYYAQTFSGGVRYTQIFGSTKIENGDTSFQPSPLVEAACLDPVPEDKQGRVICLEEAFGCDSDVGLGLNSMTEPKSREFHSPDGKMPVQEGVTFILTANGTGRQTDNQYTGIQRADDSMLSRFPVTVHFDYDTEVEKRILEKRGVKPTMAARIVKVFADLRDMIRQQNIYFDACTRRLMAVGDMCKLGLDIKESVQLAVGNVLGYAERAKLGLD